MMIYYINIDDIQEASYNPRSINNYEMKGLIESIRNFGCTQPLIVNKTTNTLVSGHQRLKAMRELNYKEVPVVYVELDIVQEKALNITMNNKNIMGEFTAELQNIMAEIQEQCKLDFLIDLNLDSLMIDNSNINEDIQEEKEVEPKEKKEKRCPHCDGVL